MGPGWWGDRKFSLEYLLSERSLLGDDDHGGCEGGRDRGGKGEPLAYAWSSKQFLCHSVPGVTGWWLSLLSGPCPRQERGQDEGGGRAGRLCPFSSFPGNPHEWLRLTALVRTVPHGHT